MKKLEKILINSLIHYIINLSFLMALLGVVFYITKIPVMGLIVGIMFGAIGTAVLVTGMIKQTFRIIKIRHPVEYEED